MSHKIIFFTGLLVCFLGGCFFAFIFTWQWKTHDMTQIEPVSHEPTALLSILSMCTAKCTTALTPCYCGVSALQHLKSTNSVVSYFGSVRWPLPIYMVVLVQCFNLAMRDWTPSLSAEHVRKGREMTDSETIPYYLTVFSWPWLEVDY